MSHYLALIYIKNERARIINAAKIDIFAEQVLVIENCNEINAQQKWHRDKLSAATAPTNCRRPAHGSRPNLFTLGW